jgi:hypothetical protein
MIWLQFLATALVIVFADVRLARYGDVFYGKWCRSESAYCSAQDRLSSVCAGSHCAE